LPRINLPPSCAGFADGDRKYMANRPGGFVNLDDTDPVDRRALQKLAGQDYASAGLVDAGPEKFWARTKDDGRWCKPCKRVWNRWNHVCPKCGKDTVPETEMPRDVPPGQHMPFGPVRGLTA
jgi:hypothetical protein